MATRRTRWLPDTHPGVEVILEWDDAVPEAEREHTPVAVYDVLKVSGVEHKIPRLHPRAEYETILAANRQASE